MWETVGEYETRKGDKEIRVLRKQERVEWRGTGVDRRWENLLAITPLRVFSVKSRLCTYKTQSSI